MMIRLCGIREVNMCCAVLCCMGLLICCSWKEHFYSLVMVGMVADKGRRSETLISSFLFRSERDGQ